MTGFTRVWLSLWIFFGPFQLVHIYFVQQGTKLYTAFHMAPDKRWVEWDTLSLLVMIFLMQLRILLALFAAESDWLLIWNLLSTRTPRSLSTELLSSGWIPACAVLLGYHRCRTSHLSLLNFIILAHPSSLSSSSRWLSQSAHFLTWVCSAKFIRVHLMLSFKSLMKRLDSVETSIDPWGTTLWQVSHLQRSYLLSWYWAVLETSGKEDISRILISHSETK